MVALLTLCSQHHRRPLSHPAGRDSL